MSKMQHGLPQMKKIGLSGTKSSSSSNSSGLPLYRQVQDGIQTLVRKSRSQTKLRFTDAELAEQFGVSRITVRRAVDELVDAGILYRIQGVGTFVRSRKLSEKLTLKSFLDPWKSHPLRAQIRVVALKRIVADSEDADRLDIPAGSKLVYVQRHRFDSGRLVAVDHRYVRAEYCRKLSAQDVRTSSLVDYLRNRENVPLSRGEMEIESRASDHEEARLFGTKLGSPLLVRRLIFFSNANEPVIKGESLYKADSVVYRLTVSADDA